MSPAMWIDLTQKEKRTAAWWHRRAETLKKCWDDKNYASQSLDLCWDSLKTSKRFKRLPSCPSRMPEVRPASKWCQQASRLPDRSVLILDPIDFSQEHLIPSLFSTLSSFTDRVSKLIDQGISLGDRARASFDSLSFPIVHELLSLIMRYSGGYELRIPKVAIPDKDLLKLSMTTLHRAKQFFEHFYHKNQQTELENGWKLERVLDSDSANIDTVIAVVDIFLDKLGKQKSKRTKRPSECMIGDESHDSKRLKVTITLSNEERKVKTAGRDLDNDRKGTRLKHESRSTDPLYSSSHAACTVRVKPESRDRAYSSTSDMDTDTEMREDRKPWHLAGKAEHGVIKSEKRVGYQCRIPAVEMKNEPLHEWMERDFR